MSNHPGPSSLDLFKRLANRFQSNFRVNDGAKKLLFDNGINDEAVWRTFRLGVGEDDPTACFSPEERKILRVSGLLPRAHRFALSATGVCIPTYMPNDLQQPVGFIRICKGQLKHHFATMPRGIACGPDLNEHGRVILCDTPLLAFRISQQGVPGVALVEDPAVLPPLADWLKGRDLHALSYMPAGVEKLRETLASLTEKAEYSVVPSNSKKLASMCQELFGVSRPTEPVPEIIPIPITQEVIANLVRYAKERFAEGHGQKLFHELGVEDVRFIETYGLGYLPVEYIRTLPSELFAALRGRLAGNSLVVPAFGERGEVVDFMLVRPDNGKNHQMFFCDPPKGLIAPGVASVFDEVLVSDSFRVVSRLVNAGHENVMMLRNPVDAEANAERLKACGLKRVRILSLRQGKKIGAVLNQAGFNVEIIVISTKFDAIPALVARSTGADDTGGASRMAMAAIAQDGKPDPEPSADAIPVDALGMTASSPFEKTVAIPDMQSSVEAPVSSDPTGALEKSQAKVAPTSSSKGDAFSDDPLHYPSPAYSNYDEGTNLALFKSKDAEYAVEVPWDAESKLEVTLRRDGQRQRDVFDFAKKRQREAFAKSAALKTGVPFECILDHLDDMLDAVRDLKAEIRDPAKSTTPKIKISETDRHEALDFLRRADLLEAIERDFDALGWVGDDRRLLPYLCATSRKLPFDPPTMPLSATSLSASGSGKSIKISTTEMLMPPEDVVRCDRITDSALSYQAHALRHKMVILEESDILTKPVIVQLRLLLSTGGLTPSTTVRDPVTGQTRAGFSRTEGPVSLFTSTAGRIDDQVLNRCLELSEDESSERTEEIIRARLKLRADLTADIAEGRKASIICRHHAIQRLIPEGKPVAIPFADRIQFSGSTVAARRMLDKFCNLICASALLHFAQRTEVDGVIHATEADFNNAKRLARDQLARANDELSVPAREVMNLVKQHGLWKFSIRDLQKHKPEWHRQWLLGAFSELLRLQFITSPVGGRGRIREYQVMPYGDAIGPAELVRLLPKAPTAENEAGALKATG